MQVGTSFTVREVLHVQRRRAAGLLAPGTGTGMWTSQLQGLKQVTTSYGVSPTGPPDEFNGQVLPARR